MKVSYKKILFPGINGLVHGGDYNPDQWLDRQDILEKDLELMKKAGINCVTLGIFSWSAYEPAEGEFHFEWLQNIMDRLYENGIHTILATPSGARPAWLDAAYPDAMRADEYGRRNHHGNRHNHCMSSENYRRLVRKIDSQLAQRFGKHPGLILWHISNEFGGYCYCDACRQRFQKYLAEQFDGDIGKLNKAWWTSFWSHTYNSFDQIEPPYADGEQSVLGLRLEWKRFTTWNTTDFMKAEIDALREFCPDVPVTTNFMTMYEELDYHAMAKPLDVISWDSYPMFHNDRETLEDTFLENAFNHALFRSIKPDQPFMMMESAPGLVNWRPFNKYKRPGVHRLACLQAVACGSDTVQYFQIRKSRGSVEQFHGAVIDHLGTDDTRVFREVAETGRSLERLAEVAGSIADNRTAILFDWDNRWAVRDVNALGQETKKYEETCISLWKEFVKMGAEPDIISSDADWSSYRVIAAPMLFMLHDGVGEKIRSFVEGGGQFLATYFTGCVDRNLLAYLGGFPGQGLHELFGLICEETDTLYPSDRNIIRWLTLGDSPREGKAEGLFPLQSEVRDYQELLRVSDAEILAVYEKDYVAGMPAVTRKRYGQGTAWYVGCRIGSGEMRGLLAEMLKNAGIPARRLPEGVEFHSRRSESCYYDFYLNTGSEPAQVEDVYGTDLLTGEEFRGEAVIPSLQVLVLKRG